MVRLVELAITRLSSKGQIVIPREMRKGMKEGEKIIAVQDGNRIVLQRVKHFSKRLEDDLKFAKSTEIGLKEYDRGLSKKVSREQLFEEMEKWFS